MDEMASRMSRTRSILPALEAALNSFKSSSSAFNVIRTINPPATSNQAVSSSEAQLPANTRTLFILDSSYNPPSRAHLALASSALSSTKEASPQRLLLLFSTHNADKAPSPASFVQRIAMMVTFAEDLQLHTSNSPASASSPPNSIAIDIGLTTAPYYTDKSQAISEATPTPYPSSPIHIHLLGYDTLTRFLAPKYYSKFSPPLSALEPFFSSGHKLLVLLRPDSSSDNSVSGDSEEEQRAYIKSLVEGSLEDQGMKTEWAKQIVILEGGDVVANAAGISSTVIRKAAKKGEWAEVRKMCSPGVAGWIQDQRLYEDDDKGPKMA